MAIKNVAAFLFASMLSIIGIAQMNLLPNGGFDEMKGKVKKPGQNRTREELDLSYGSKS